MSVNPNSNQEASIAFRSPPAGSCWNQAMLDELKKLIVVTIPPGATNIVPPIAAATNNIASLDAANAIFVPATEVFTQTQTNPAGSSTPLIFTGWPSSIDATTAFLEVMLYLDTTEPGIETATSSGRFMRPNWEITQRVADTIKIKVVNSAHASQVSIRLASVPVAPAQS